jgi:dUTPase
MPDENYSTIIASAPPDSPLPPAGEDGKNEDGAKDAKKKGGAEEKRVSVRVKKINPSLVPLPSKDGEESACYDICADLAGTPFGKDVYLPAGRMQAIPANFRFGIPPGYAVQITAKKEYLPPEVIAVNLPAVLDSASKEEVQIEVFNFSKQAVRILHGQKIARFTVHKIQPSVIKE